MATSGKNATAQLNEQIADLTRTIITALGGVRRDVTAMTSVNVLMNMAIDGHEGDKDAAEAYVRNLIDRACARMHRGGGLVQ